RQNRRNPSGNNHLSASGFVAPRSQNAPGYVSSSFSPLAQPPLALPSPSLLAIHPKLVVACPWIFIQRFLRSFLFFFEWQLILYENKLTRLIILGGVFIYQLYISRFSMAS